MIIGCDVDDVIVNTAYYWWEWLNSVTKRNKVFPYGDTNIDFALGNYFKDDLQKINKHGLDFFRSSGIYDTMHPYPDSVKVLEGLHKDGAEIVFVSHVKGHHGKSKAEFIKRHFPFFSGIVYTKEKKYVGCDVFIDDRHKHINNTQADIKILFRTPFEQCQPLTVPCHVADGWNEVDLWVRQLM